MNMSRTIVARVSPPNFPWMLAWAMGVVATSFASAGEPTEPISFGHARVTDAWKKYADVLTFGRGQTLALVDDGCKLSMPEWSTPVDGRAKVLVSYDSVDGDDDPKHEGRGYHGSTIGVPSSLNYMGKWGVAHGNQVAVVRGLECCHCNVSDSRTLAVGLQWIIGCNRWTPFLAWRSRCNAACGAWVGSHCDHCRSERLKPFSQRTTI